MKRILSLAMIIGLALALIGCAGSAVVPSEPAAKAVAAGPAPLAQPVSLVILHSNDVHARAVESKTELGYARIASIVGKYRAMNPNTIVIDAGDAFHGLPIANVEAGASIVRLMNAVGYDFMTPGNHDFNYGQERLLELNRQASFTILAANVYKGGQRLFTPYYLGDYNGLRVAIFGLATPETLFKSDPKNTEGLTFTDPIAEAKKVVAELAGEYDLLIAIAHLGVDASSDPTSVKVAAAVPQIDVLIDGHSHSSLAEIELVNKSGALVASAVSYGVGFGVVEIEVGKDRKIAKRSARTITPASDPDLVSNPAVKAMLDGITKEQDAILSVKVGATAVALEGKREIVRTSESNLGKLIANGMRSATGADIAFINGGGLRDSIPAGDITKKQIFTVQPFGNLVWTTKVKGSELDAIVEHGVGKLPAADGRFPHWANLTYTLDAAAQAGSRVSDIKIGGVPIVDGKEYVLALLNFEFNGGDEYTMFKGKAYNEFQSDAEITMAYIQKLGTVTQDNIEMK